MPLIRFHVRNEFALGEPELYRSVNKEDPRAVLDGVAVAGLVGILRQLGDLAEFASEVFHELHEQVTITAARSHKMVIRVQNIEAALPPLEKAIATQRSHIHFAYTAGSEWHSDIRSEKNHFSHSDLPQFIMDSYEECRGPPRLFLLDKFDPAGAGACLKRYSDPSLFRKACTNSELLKAEKVHKEKKSHSKRKGLQNKSGYISGASSMSQRYSSDRLRFVSMDTSGQLLTGENTPTFNMRSRSEFARELVDNNSKTSFGYHERDMSSSSSIAPHEVSNIRPDSPFASQSASFDSKSRLNNVCSSDSSVGFQGQEHHELYTGEPRVKFVDDPSTSPNEQNEEHRGQGSPHVSFSEQGALRSSFVSWDEKTEILNPSCEQSSSEDHGLALECPPTSIPLSKLEVSITSLKTTNQEDIIFDIENAPELLSGANHFEEVTSEIDNYMDALNTMDTEIETDSECQTKHEVELKHNVSPPGIQSSICQASTTGDQMSDPFNGESPVPLRISVVKERFEESPCPHHEETLTHIEQPLPTQLDSNLDDAVDACFSGKSEPFDTPTVNGFESLHTVQSSESTIPDTNDDKVVPQSGHTHKSSVISDVSPVQIWTNGGLLGLEPSKPSDFGISNVQKQNCQDPLLSLSENSLGERNQLSPNGISNNQSAAGELDQNNVETSSIISGLTYRFLRNASWRKASPSVHMTTEPSIVEENNLKILPEGPNSVDKHKGLNGVVHHDIHKATSKDSPPDFFQFGSPSPPLEHMKISFHPMNGIETAKLKLEFPDAPHCRENTQDVTFPSFQLLPESCNLLQDSGFESDGDTFCRSSPYLSDDPLSPHSDSNSEHWEHGEINGSGSHEFYDALHRVSSSSSISSVLGPDEEMDASTSQACDLSSLNVENGKKSSGKCDIRGLPSFDAESCLTSQLAEDGLNVKDSLDTALICPIELPPPPPLPPLQWRKTKLNMDGTPNTSPGTETLSDGQQVDRPIVINELFPVGGAMSISKNATCPEACEQPTDQLVMMSTSQRQATLIPKQIDSTTPLLNKNTLDGQKVNGRKELSPVSNGKDGNEKEDFLHQIRTKSFNLRPTATARPNINPSPTTNTKVTAILEKANAIRQAVGSDEGADDDNWSDT